MFEIILAYVLLWDFITIAIAVRCVRSKAYFRPHIYDDVIMHVIFKGELFEFICHGRTKNRVVFCELYQDWFEFIEVYKTQTTRVNVKKKV